MIYACKITLNTLLSKSEHKRANPKKAMTNLCHDLSSLNLRGSRVLLVMLVACQSACEYSHVSKVSSSDPADIMVQELVKHGALDLYLKKSTSVSVSWKLDVAKQLACALNFLVRNIHAL